MKTNQLIILRVVYTCIHVRFSNLCLVYGRFFPHSLIAAWFFYCPYFGSYSHLIRDADWWNWMEFRRGCTPIGPWRAKGKEYCKESLRQGQVES